MITDILTIVMAILLILIIVFFAVLVWASGVEKARRTEEWKHYGLVDKCGFDSIDDEEQLACIRNCNDKQKNKAKRRHKCKR